MLRFSRHETRVGGILGLRKLPEQQSRWARAELQLLQDERRPRTEDREVARPVRQQTSSSECWNCDRQTIPLVPTLLNVSDHMDKQHILAEIRRTTKENGGTPLGHKRFEQATGIGYHDWWGKHWGRWGDALKEAGFAPIL